MYLGKNFVASVVTAVIWGISFILVYMTRFQYGASAAVSGLMVLAAAFAVTYFVLRSLDQTYAQNAKTRVDRILDKLDDAELDALRDRLSAGIDGEYGSLEELLVGGKQKRG